MQSCLEWSWERVLRNLKQLGRFGVVGASGVLVNLAIVALLDHVGPLNTSVLVDLPGTDLNARWYHAYVAGAFAVANLWNYQLNRIFTFTGSKPSWLRGYRAFLGVGLAGLVGNLLIVTVLLHPDSPVNVASTLRVTAGQSLMIANFVGIVLVTPITFALTKMWAFQDTRRRRLVAARSAAA